jgi:Mrp family chromosome partitioning ATPase
VALDLGRELGEIGLRPVVVEANPRRPDPRYGSAGGGADNGLQAVLSGGGDLAQCVVPATGDLPARVPVGTAPGTGRLQGLYQLSAQLEGLLQHYDLVVVDAAPILLSADTEFLVPRVHTAVLVVQARSVIRGEVRRAGQVLSRLDPPAAGAILNRVSLFQGGGYFTELAHEYTTGTRRPPTRWSSPWLWR